MVFVPGIAVGQIYESGCPVANPPILWDIDSAPGLADTKLIAEAWDAAGLYQVGSFVGDFWKEWNGRFRDDVRSFMKADDDTVTRIPYRLLGSPDIYGRAQREPEQSINFVTCHDGFTLYNLVSCHGVKLHRPDWNSQSHSLAITASAVSANLDLYLVLNAYWEPLRFDLPPIPEDGLGPWRRWLDTFLETPDDVCRPSNASVVTGSSYLVNPRSIVALARIAN